MNFHLIVLLISLIRIKKSFHVAFCLLIKKFACCHEIIAHHSVLFFNPHWSIMAHAENSSVFLKKHHAVFHFGCFDDLILIISLIFCIISFFWPIGKIKFHSKKILFLLFFNSENLYWKLKSSFCQISFFQVLISIINAEIIKSQIDTLFNDYYTK